MSRIGRGPGALRRWATAGAFAASVAAAPSIVAGLPVRTPDTDPRALLRRVVASERVPYAGYAESSSAIGLPDVPQIGRLVDLLGETSRLRVWYAAPDRWRVDTLTHTGERGTYADGGALWLWDSGDRRVTRVAGEPRVRLPRAADFLPPELGRRLARLATDRDRVTGIGARRVAGRAAGGIRIEPHPEGTTVARVDLWADPATALPLRVEVTPKGRSRPLVATAFHSFDSRRPTAEEVAFRRPPGTGIDFTTAGDLAARLDQELVVPLPETLAGLRRRATVARAAATYGTGYGIVAVVALPERLAFRVRDRLRPPFAATVEGSYGEATVVVTPLVNGLLVLDRRRFVGFAVSGTVPPETLLVVASDLVRP